MDFCWICGSPNKDKHVKYYKKIDAYVCSDTFGKWSYDRKQLFKEHKKRTIKKIIDNYLSEEKIDEILEELYDKIDYTESPVYEDMVIEEYESSDSSE